MMEQAQKVKLTQKHEVLEYLKTHDTMTAKEAYDLFGAERLAAIVHWYRKHGHLIESIDCTGKNRYGETTNFTKYKYVEYNGLDNTIAVQKLRGEL